MSNNDNSKQLPNNDRSVMSHFPEEAAKKAFLRANCRCQCERDKHDHGAFTCFKQIILKHRGNKTERSGWEAHYFLSPEKGGKLSVENCEILCWGCYSKIVQSQ